VASNLPATDISKGYMYMDVIKSRSNPQQNVS